MIYGLLGTPMAAWRAAALMMVLFAATTASCAAEDVEGFLDSQLTREQWQRRLDEARQRTESFVAKLRSQPSEPFVSQKERQEIADQRAVRDQTLQPGDIVATSRGLLIYTGRDDDNSSGAFTPLAPDQRDGIDQSPQGQRNR